MRMFIAGLLFFAGLTFGKLSLRLVAFLSEKYDWRNYGLKPSDPKFIKDDRNRSRWVAQYENFAETKRIPCEICHRPVQSYTAADLAPICDECGAAMKKNAGHWAGTVKEEILRVPLDL